MNTVRKTLLLILIFAVLSCTATAKRETSVLDRPETEKPEGMVLIPAGEFMVGSPSGEGDDDERPQHKVSVDAFYMDKHEVAVGEYKKFLQATGHQHLPARVAGHNVDDDCPVVGVSWEDATAYAEWSGKRLPTEAEWEYACRAGTTTAYNVGDTISRDDANYYGTDGKDRWDLGAAPAGNFPPNAWGLYDMHGNVWEWCSDWYDKDYYGKSPSSNPTGPAGGTYRAVRGGSWGSRPFNIRSANRGHNRVPTLKNNSLGFRCARDIPAKPSVPLPEPGDSRTD